MSDEPATAICEMPIDSANYRASALGIEFLVDLTLEEWVSLGAKLGRAGRSLGFLIGDWLNYGGGKGEWGDTYARAMQITGLEYKTLRDYASVSRKVPVSLRNDKLAFELHKKVAPLKDPEQQKKWLRLAEKQAEKGKPISSRRLAKSILLERLASDQDLSTPRADRGRKSVQLHILRLLTLWRKMEESDWLEHADPFAIKALLDDLRPVLQMGEKLQARVDTLPSVETPPSDDDAGES